MSKITIEVEIEKLSEKGRAALAVLFAEVSKPAVPLQQAETADQLAEKVYKQLARTTAMKGVLDALLDSSTVSQDDLWKAAGYEGWGAAMSGVLSSLTRNFQKCGGKGVFHHRETGNDGKYVFRLMDEEMRAPLLRSRERYQKNLV